MVGGCRYVGVIGGRSGVYRLLVGVENAHMEVEVDVGQWWVVGKEAGIGLELVEWGSEVEVWWLVGKLVVVACRDWLELYRAFLCIGIKVGLWTSLLHLQR